MRGHTPRANRAMRRPMPPLRFHSACPDDIEAIVDLVRRGSRGEESKRGWTSEAHLVEGLRTDADQVGEMMSADAQIIVGESAGNLLACCHCDCRTGQGHIGMLTVDPGCQGAGLGSEMLGFAENWLRDRQARASLILVLDQLPALGSWYERRGYVRTGTTIPFSVVNERYGRSKVDDLRFEERIKPLTHFREDAGQPELPGAI